MTSEPSTHFLGHARLAPVQVLFWGNPMTSGNSAIDYFISGDRLEHPYRTLLHADDEPYTEQVVSTVIILIRYTTVCSARISRHTVHISHIISMLLLCYL
jgi:predicted O-linked N-acetylglucosamine transferase (SPINDLY family)